MHPSFLNVLRSPLSQSPFHLETTETASNGMVITGELTTRQGETYPIVRGIPRFVRTDEYAASFGFEWQRWRRVQFDSENQGLPMAGHTTRMWETNTGIHDQFQAGEQIVDFGCGPGRFLDVVRRKNARAIGIDLSQAVEVARQNFADDPDVLIVQGDILQSPFVTGIFDGGYTIGVLHHTPDPAGGLAELARTVKDHGWVACCVYPRGEFYDYPSVRRWRSLHHRLAPTFGYRPALAYSQLAAYGFTPILARVARLPIVGRLIQWIEREWLPTLDIPNKRWRMLDIFDAITPAIATTHTAEELEAWMKAAHCIDLQQTSWCSTSFTGMKIASTSIANSA